MKLDRLVRLEKRLAGALDKKLHRPGVAADPLELVPMILDAVEERIQPLADGRRVFPYDRLSVRVCIEPGRLAAARTVFEHTPTLGDRIRERLKEARCSCDALEVTVKIAEGTPPEKWGGAPFHISGRTARARRPEPEAPDPGPPPVRIVVLAGAAGARGHLFQLERIQVGRMRRVEERIEGTARHNHVAFEDDGGDVNASVSRAHASIRWDAEARAWRVFDEGSAHGTRVLRSGKELAVPKQGSRGVTLRDRDEIEFGRARVRFLIEWPESPGKD